MPKIKIVVEPDNSPSLYIREYLEGEETFNSPIIEIDQELLDEFKNAKDLFFSLDFKIGKLAGIY